MRYRNTLKNRTYRYVFPMIVDIINYHDNLLGIYISDLNKPKYNNHIFLQYEFDLNFEEAHLKFEEYIQSNDLFEDLYDLKDGSVMFVLKVPNQFQLDYDFFIKSKYSKFSEALKEKILNFHVAIDKPFFRGILYKTKDRFEKLKEKLGESDLNYNMEFDSKWEEKDEIFNYEEETKMIEK